MYVINFLAKIIAKIDFYEQLFFKLFSELLIQATIERYRLEWILIKELFLFVNIWLIMAVKKSANDIF